MKKNTKTKKGVIRITAKRKRTVKKRPRQAKLAEPAASFEVTIRKKVLGDAPEEHHFVLRDGKRLRNLFELVDELETMHDDVFGHHVCEFHNHFANWVKDVFNEHELAEEIKNIENRMEMQRALIRKLVKEVMELKK